MNDLVYVFIHYAAVLRECCTCSMDEILNSGSVGKNTCGAIVRA